MQLFTYSLAGCSVVKTRVRPATEGREMTPSVPGGGMKLPLALPLLQRTRRDLTAEVSGRGEICEISRDMLQGTLRDARLATLAEQAAPEPRAAARTSGSLEPGRRREHMRRSSRKLASAAQALNPPPPYSARWGHQCPLVQTTSFVWCVVILTQSAPVLSYVNGKRGFEKPVQPAELILACLLCRPVPQSMQA